jgi:hypothetical protein
MAFTVLTWNVEHFGSKRPGETNANVQARIQEVFALLKSPAYESDVYAISEVNGAMVFDLVTAEFPDYSWQITEGPGAQEILVGFRIPAFVTQRLEFSRGFTGPLRPGALVSLAHEGQNYAMLFLHLKAADEPVDFGVRVHQHEKARSLRKALDAATDAERANFIVAGDLNSVGMNLTFSNTDVTTGDEVSRLHQMYGSQFDQMPVRVKSQPHTFWNGPGSSDPPVDLDHVIAAERINFEAVAGTANAEVEVKGWPEETTDVARAAWIAAFSDHAALRFTVTGAG